MVIKDLYDACVNLRPGNETVAVCFTQWRSGASSGPMAGGMHGVNACSRSIVIVADQ